MTIIMIIDLSKQQKHDFDPKATQQINLTEHLENHSPIYFIIEETLLVFAQGIVKVY